MSHYSLSKKNMIILKVQRSYIHFWWSSIKEKEKASSKRLVLIDQSNWHRCIELGNLPELDQSWWRYLKLCSISLFQILTIWFTWVWFTACSKIQVSSVSSIQWWYLVMLFLRRQDLEDNSGTFAETIPYLSWLLNSPWTLAFGDHSWMTLQSKVSLGGSNLDSTTIKLLDKFSSIWCQRFWYLACWCSMRSSFECWDFTISVKKTLKQSKMEFLETLNKVMLKLWETKNFRKPIWTLLSLSYRWSNNRPTSRNTKSIC